MKCEWEPFFKDNGEYVITVRFYEGSGAFTVEELYQAIKERLKDELVADTGGRMGSASRDRDHLDPPRDD